jgi:hypothetical protein
VFGAVSFAVPVKTLRVGDPEDCVRSWSQGVGRPWQHEKLLVRLLEPLLVLLLAEAVVREGKKL